MTADSANEVFYAVGCTVRDRYDNVTPRVGATRDAIIMKFNATAPCPLLLHVQLVVDLGTLTTWYGVAVDSTGDLWVCGITSSPSSFLDVPTCGSTDGVVMKFAPNGTYLVADVVGAENVDVLYAVATDRNNNAYVIGYSNSISVNDQINAGKTIDIFLHFVCVRVRSNLISFTFPTFLGNKDVLIVKYTSAGQKQWTKRYGGAGSEQGNAILVDDAGGVVYVVGTSSSGSGHSRHHRVGT